MKTETLSLLLSLGAVTLARPNPQSTPNLQTLPTCAQAAALQAVTSTGCVLTDAECFCKNTGFIQALQQAITTGCGGSDQDAACSWGTQACSAFGVSLPCDATAQSPNTDAPNVAPSMSMTDIMGINSATISMSMTSTDSMQSMATGGSSSVMSNNGTWMSPTSTGGPAQFTGAAGAAVNTYPGFLSVIAGVALGFAFF